MEVVEVGDEVLVAASTMRTPPPRNWVSLLVVKVTVEVMVDTVDKRMRNYNRNVGKLLLPTNDITKFSQYLP